MLYPHLQTLHPLLTILGMEPGRIPNTIRMYRKRSGLTQSNVCRIIELPDDSSMYRWEKGMGMPNGVHLFALASLFNVQAEQLYPQLVQKIRERVARMYMTDKINSKQKHTMT